MASAQQASHGVDALALAQGSSQGSAQLPSAAPGAALFPGELTSSLPSSEGGVGLVHVPTQVQALQAKVISCVLEPARLAWKVFKLYHRSQAFLRFSRWAMGPAACPARSAQTTCNCQLGCLRTWRPSKPFVLTAFNQPLPCCHNMS